MPAAQAAPTPPAPFIPQTPQAAPAPIVDGARVATDAARAKAIARVTAPVVPPAGAEPATPAAPAKIEMDAATLKQMTKQAAALRAAQARVVELEAGSKDVGAFAAAKKLYGEGKRLEAIAMLSGNDPSAEMEALMGAYLDSAPPAAVDPVKAEIDALKAKDAARDAADAEMKKQRAAQAAKERDASIQGFAWSILDAAKLPDGSPQFELCSLPKNRGEAAVAALVAVKIFAAAEHADGNVTPEQAKALYTRAFAEVEAEYERDFAERAGSRFVPRGYPPPRQVPGQPVQRVQTTATPAPAEPTRANQSPTLSRPSITTQSQPKSLTPQQALAKAIEKVRGFRQ